jgi:hypothetical protein
MSGSCDNTPTPLGFRKEVTSVEQLNDYQLLNQISSIHVFNQLLIAAETKLFFLKKKDNMPEINT